MLINMFQFKIPLDVSLESIKIDISDDELQKKQMTKEDITPFIATQNEEELNAKSVAKLAKCLFSNMKIKQHGQAKKPLRSQDTKSSTVTILKGILETWLKRKRDRATVAVLSTALKQSDLSHLVPILTKIIRVKIKKKKIRIHSKVPIDYHLPVESFPLATFLFILRTTDYVN